MRVAKWALVAVLAGTVVMSVAQGQEDEVTVVDPSKLDPNATTGERIGGSFSALAQLHRAGGGAMWAIDACLLIGVAFIIERLVRLRRSTTIPTPLLNAVEEPLYHGDLDTVREASREYNNSILGKVMLYLSNSRGISREEREETANTMASREFDVHRMMCVPLAAIFGIAPLIGLLGTVMGIRECFRDVALSGKIGNPAMLAGGIEKALLTTIYGLLVAIPTLAAYNAFRLRINLLANQMEEVLATALSRGVFREDRCDDEQGRYTPPADEQPHESSESEVTEAPAGA